MKFYENNKQSAEQLLEIAFAILRNEGQQPVVSIALVYKLLTRDIDVTTTQQAALHGYAQQVDLVPYLRFFVERRGWLDDDWTRRLEQLEADFQRKVN
jgi:hypothetical protein